MIATTAGSRDEVRSRSTYAANGDESGTIIIHDARPFQFVIEAFGSYSPWLLTIEGYPYTSGLQAPAGDTGTSSDERAPQAESTPRPGIELKRIPGEVPSRDNELALADA